MTSASRSASATLIIDKISKSYTSSAISATEVDIAGQAKPDALSKSQPHVTDILSSISLIINRGEFLSIVGPSGCGKSTLLQICGLLDKPSCGNVNLAGVEMCYADGIKHTRSSHASSSLPQNKDTATEPPQHNLNGKHEATNSSDSYADNDMLMTQLRRDNIGFIYQFHHLLPEFSAIENVMLPLIIKNTEKYSYIYNKAEEILTKLGLSTKKNSEISALSGGERQRVAIARALIGEPKLILADEPTGNLDQHNAQEVFTLLLEQVRNLGAAMLLVTHDVSLADQADRRYRLEAGHLVALN